MSKFKSVPMAIMAFVILAALSFAGLSPAHADSSPSAVGVVYDSRAYIEVDARRSDTNLETPAVNSKIIISERGKNGRTYEFTYYSQMVNTYEVYRLAGWLDWMIIDTRDPSQVMAAGTIDGRFPEERSLSVYWAAGYYEVNGRQWMTWCEPYSQTERCRTEIWATQAQEVAPGIYANVNGWVFNNLTYLPSSRSLWVNNPLGGHGKYGYEGSWTDEDGRQWRVQCDTSLSGRGGCRADIKATVIEHSSGSFRQVDKWLFNNLVRFG